MGKGMRWAMACGVLFVVGSLASTAGCRRARWDSRVSSAAAVSHDRHTREAPSRQQPAVPAPRAYAAVPPVTPADWDTRAASRPAYVSSPSAPATGHGPWAAAPTPPTGHPARWSAPADARAELAATPARSAAGAIPAAMPIMPAASEYAALASLPIPDGPASDARLLTARQALGMAAPALPPGSAPPRTEVWMASAGAVPAALRASASGRPLPAASVVKPSPSRWGGLLPDMETERVFLLPVAAAGAAARSTVMTAGPEQRWLARGGFAAGEYRDGRP